MAREPEVPGSGQYWKETENKEKYLRKLGRPAEQGDDSAGVCFLLSIQDGLKYSILPSPPHEL